MSRHLFWHAFLSFFLLLILPEHAIAASGGQKILIVTSNQHTYGNTTISAANHFEEIVIAYDVFKKAGFIVEFVSPQGGAIPIAYVDTANKTQKDHLYDPAFMNLLKTTRRPAQIDAASFKAVYYSGGGSAMFGVADNAEIQAIANKIYSKGGVISAICHGTAGIVNLKNPDGTPLLLNRKITGFPDMFEDTKAAYYKAFPFSIDKKVGNSGGMFVYSKQWAANFFVVDGNVITGQDPSATVSVAQEVIKAIRKGSHS